MALLLIVLPFLMRMAFRYGNAPRSQWAAIDLEHARRKETKRIEKRLRRRPDRDPYEDTVGDLIAGLLACLMLASPFLYFGGAIFYYMFIEPFTGS